MNLKKVPEVYRSVIDNSITLSFGEPTKSLIWLHGRGGTAESFLSFFSHSFSPLYKNTRIKLLEAPVREISVSQGEKCNAWYDIYSLNRFVGDEKAIFNFDHVAESIKIIDSHIDDQIMHWKEKQQKSEVSNKINPAHRIFIGGFSQGGTMAFHYGLESEKIVAGVAGFGTYLFRSTELKNLKKFPIYITHGEDDEIIVQAEAKETYERLINKSDGMIDYHRIPRLGHSVNLEQLKILNEWLSASFGVIEKHYSKYL